MAVESTIVRYEKKADHFKFYIFSKGRCKRESKNKKQETKRFSTFAVYRLRHSETRKTLLDSRIMFKRNMCETANQQYI